MGKNRDYTGLVRTPSSMAWLIRERSHPKGQIERCLKEMGQLPRKLAGTRTKKKSLVPYGQLTKEILRALREANGEPLRTLEIVYQVARFTGPQRFE